MVTWSEERTSILDVQKRSPMEDIKLKKMNLVNGRGTAQFMELIR
jgi:hypothetical protein